MPDERFGPTSLQVLEAAAAVVQGNVPDAGMRTTMLDIVGRFAQGWAAGTAPHVPPLSRIPALTYAAVRGDFEASLPLCGVAFLLYLGIDILDDVMDGDATPYWQGRSPAETLLIGATLTASVPQLAISRLDAAPAVRDAMQQTLAAGLLGMAAGQRADILGTRATCLEPSEVEASVVAKSGHMTAMLAALGAQLAGAPSDVVGAYHAWGRAYGAAEQIRSDCAVLFRPGPCADLQNGTVTYPLACLLEGTPPERREYMFKLMADAEPGTASRFAVRGLLIESGALSMSAVTTGWHVARGRAALNHAAPTAEASTALQTMLDQVSFKSGLFRESSSA
jgi:heptaprenyl diphosphate synthase